jgi:hypothetical protein
VFRFLLARLHKFATDFQHGMSHQISPRTQLRRQTVKPPANLLKIVQADLTQSFNRLRANTGEPLQFLDRHACQVLVESFLEQTVLLLTPGVVELGQPMVGGIFQMFDLPFGPANTTTPAGFRRKAVNGIQQAGYANSYQEQQNQHNHDAYPHGVCKPPTPHSFSDAPARVSSCKSATLLRLTLSLRFRKIKRQARIIPLSHESPQPTKLTSWPRVAENFGS